MLIQKSIFTEHSVQYFVEFSDVSFDVDTRKFAIMVTVGLQTFPENAYLHPLFVDPDVELLGRRLNRTEWSWNKRVIDDVRYAVCTKTIEAENAADIVRLAEKEADDVIDTICDVVNKNRSRAETIPVVRIKMYAAESI